MGWGSANEIFDPVAQALIKADASDELIVATLSKLIDKLRDGDWDTWDESRERFADSPAVQAAFAKVGCGREDDDADE